MRLEESHLFREIHEQPAVIERFLRTQHEVTLQLAAEIRRRNITHVVISARGTSDNAGRYATYTLGGFNGLPVALATPSLHTVYLQPPRFQNALVLGISQSGKSPDIVSVVAEARRQGALTASITNAVQSPLAEESDFVIDVQAGDEYAVAATKSYTSQVAAISLLSALLADDAARLEELARLPDAIARTLEMNDTIAEAAPRYRYMNACVVIGRGFNYATAFEMALKMKELTYTIAEPYSSADFLHGPIAMVQEGFPVMVIAPQGALSGEQISFVEAVQKRHGEVLAISDNEALLAHARTPLHMPVSVPEWLSPITAIVPGQMFAMHLAHARDYNVDAPRGLSKVTETR
jgi:glucosamine--fructose-6-phosphate aminotransferase (isomerizing)